MKRVGVPAYKIVFILKSQNWNAGILGVWAYWFMVGVKRCLIAVGFSLFLCQVLGVNAEDTDAQPLPCQGCTQERQATRQLQQSKCYNFLQPLENIVPQIIWPDLLNLASVVKKKYSELEVYTF